MSEACDGAANLPDGVNIFYCLEMQENEEFCTLS